MNKSLIKIINETISDYNFLSMNEISEEENLKNIIKSKDFQIQFINDLINNFNKTKFKDIDISYKEVKQDVIHNDSYSLSIEYTVEFKYSFDNVEYQFLMLLNGNGINSNDSIKWNNINIKLFDKNGNEININWLKNNPRLYEVFIRSFVESLLNYKNN
jgi:hypothetical protein